MTWKNKILSGPYVSIIVGALMVSLIVTSFVVCMTVLTGFALLVVVYYSYRFVSSQIMVIKRFTIEFVQKISSQFIKVYK